MTTDALDARVEHARIDEFNRKLAERVRIRSEVEWADEPEAGYLFGLHPLALIVPAVLAFGLWIHMTFLGG